MSIQHIDAEHEGEDGKPVIHDFATFDPGPPERFVFQWKEKDLGGKLVPIEIRITKTAGAFGGTIDVPKSYDPRGERVRHAKVRAVDGGWEIDVHATDGDKTQYVLEIRARVKPASLTSARGEPVA